MELQAFLRLKNFLFERNAMPGFLKNILVGCVSSRAEDREYLLEREDCDKMDEASSSSSHAGGKPNKKLRDADTGKEITFVDGQRVVIEEEGELRKITEIHANGMRILYSASNGVTCKLDEFFLIKKKFQRLQKKPLRFKAIGYNSQGAAAFGIDFSTGENFFYFANPNAEQVKKIRKFHIYRDKDIGYSTLSIQSKDHSVHFQMEDSEPLFLNNKLAIKMDPKSLFEDSKEDFPEESQSVLETAFLIAKET